MSQDLRRRLEAVVTRYDRSQVGKRSYNIYALAQYMMAVDSLIELLEAGKPQEKALISVINPGWKLFDLIKDELNKS
jgi:hypothetical protein